ncbi:hypothetical protein CHS0354_013424, partial [Potamilus streckersoni]
MPSVSAYPIVYHRKHFAVTPQDALCVSLPDGLSPNTLCGYSSTLSESPNFTRKASAVLEKSYISLNS